MIGEKNVREEQGPCEKVLYPGLFGKHGKVMPPRIFKNCIQCKTRYKWWDE